MVLARLHARTVPPRRLSRRLHFHCAPRVCHPRTRIYAGLLGPCFQTSALSSFCQHLARETGGFARGEHAPSSRAHPTVPVGHARQHVPRAAPRQRHTRQPPQSRDVASAHACNGARANALLPFACLSTTRATHVDQCTAVSTARRHACVARRRPRYGDLTTLTTRARAPDYPGRHLLLNLMPSLLTISSTFHPLFKVLFIFRSRYLFAIGLQPLFSFSGNLPAM